MKYKKSVAPVDILRVLEGKPPFSRLDLARGYPKGGTGGEKQTAPNAGGTRPHLAYPPPKRRASARMGHRKASLASGRRGAPFLAFRGQWRTDKAFRRFSQRPLSSRLLPGSPLFPPPTGDNEHARDEREGTCRLAPRAGSHYPQRLFPAGFSPSHGRQLP